MHVPTFRPGLIVKVLKNRGVLLISETEDILLKGRAIERVAAIIDGQKSESQIVQALAEDLSAPEVHYCLLRLAKSGFLSDNHAGRPPSLIAFWQEAGMDPDAAFHAYKHTRISLGCIGDLSSRAFEDLLNGAGISTGAGGHLHVVLADSYLAEELGTINKQSLATRQPWLLVKPVGRQIWLGPLFYPGSTGCWRCLQERLYHQRPLYQLTADGDRAPPPLSTDRHTPASVSGLALHLATIEILKWFGAESSHPLAGAVRSYDVHTHESQMHVLTRRPQCAACGSRALQEENRDLEPALQNRKKDDRAEGGFRTVDPQTTFEQYKRHISPITGIVRHVRPVPFPISKTHPNVHMYSADHNRRPLSNQPHDLPALLRDQSAGKGFTKEQARTSALCEALERYSGIYQGYERRVLASFDELEDAIHPNRCMLFSDKQYDEREAWHAVCDHLFQRVPTPFEPGAQIDWTPVWSLTLQRTRYLPTAYCYFNYRGPHPDFCRADSNGNAAGNTLEEAILQGFLEVVERDCVSMWWYNRVQRPAVDIQSFEDPRFAALESYYRSIGRSLWVIDLTADLNIPTFAALSRRTDRRPEDIIFGFGSHLNAEIAVRRALSEMNQLLPFVIEQLLDGSTRYAYEGKLELKWWQTATADEHSYLLPDPQRDAKVAADYKNPSTMDILADIDACVRAAGNLGLETLILDQTRPDVGLPVVKVIVPGMRIFWKRLAPGRLYDVPVKSGWIDRPTLEKDLNPFPFFL